MPPKIYPPYGELNRVEIPKIQNRLDLQNGTVGNILRTVTKQTFTPDATANTGPYKAIVLRVDVDPISPEPGSWENYLPFFGSTPPALLRIKARIPEIHAMLPIPETLGQDSKDHAVIEMHSTFIAQNKDVEKPEPGSLVWVDFGNKTNFTDGIYIKPVVDGQPAGAPAGKVSSAGSFGNACANSFNSIAPKGDPMPGRNKPLSHAGLPLLPRKPKSVTSGEYNIIRGNRASAMVVRRWESAVKKRKLPGKTWIGTLNSNGLVDEAHPEGKRSTIIFAPNTTDFAHPVEFIYYFHGLGGFNHSIEFDSRIVQTSKQLATAGRNFVIIVPELPWAYGIKNWKKRAGDWAWNPYETAPGNRKGTKDNFSNFHRETTNILKRSFSDRLRVGYITIVGFGQGGAAIKTAAVHKSLDFVRPNKITLANASYGDWHDEIWIKYASRYSDVEFNLLTGNGSAYNNALKFVNTYRNKLRQNVKVQRYKLSHGAIGTEAIIYVNPTMAQIEDEKSKRSFNDEKTKRPDPVTQELPFPSPIELSGLPKQVGAYPPVGMGNSKTSASTITKNALGKGQKKPLPKGVVTRKARPYSEARVYVKDYGSIPTNSNLLVSVPGPGGSNRKLHKLAARRFHSMNAAWLNDNPGSQPLLVVSGHRKRRWPDRESYEAAMWKKFPQGGPKEARKYIAYISPHETGLALDIGSNGLWPSRKTNDKQKQTKCYKWLVDNAHKFGFTPYKVEAWHWECRLPKESWASGEEFTDDYATRVVKVGEEGSMLPITSPAKGLSGGACVAVLGDVAGPGASPENIESEVLSKMIGEPNTEGVLAKNQKKDLVSRLAERIGIEPEIAYAFFTVESGNKPGFCANTGRPLIRFEPHVFASPKRLKKWGISRSDVPWDGNSSSERKRNWRMLGFRHGSTCKNNHYEFQALAAALKIHEEHAYQSISVGAAQIMGFNHTLVGYRSAKKMYEAYSKSESAQIVGFFKYVERRAGGKMLSALKRKDLVTAALYYNGRGKQHIYASKIEKYYNHYKTKGIPV